MIQITDLTKDFRSTSGNGFCLSDVTMQVLPGTMVAIMGTNGSGKSTLLKLIAGQISPDGGSVDFSDAFYDPPMTRCPVLYLDQDSGRDIVPSMTVAENLFLAQIPGTSGTMRFPFRRERRAAAVKMLRRIPLGLEGRLHEQARFLSGGEKQALVFARALLCNSKVLLLDEFSSALATDLAVKVMETLKADVQDEGKYCLFITHHMDIAFRFADDIIFLHNGKVVAGPMPNTAAARESVVQLYAQYLREVIWHE